MSTLFLISSKLGSCSRVPYSDKNLNYLTEDQYNNIQILTEVFLEGFPIDQIDLGVEMDKFFYKKAGGSVQFDEVIMDVPDLFSSPIFGILIDRNPIPVAFMNSEDRVSRIKQWKNSESEFSRSMYRFLNEFTVFLISGSKRILEIMEYKV
ncbi:MAG: hypothetical protein H7A24_09620 [Leptospiraceae bacterium]|nr:hypothetical protein [Leptospiraceae bacterium]MCP5512129.1 hypothetical protein [Leptospiraceae bacterium]